MISRGFDAFLQPTHAEPAISRRCVAGSPIRADVTIALPASWRLPLLAAVEPSSLGRAVSHAIAASRDLPVKRPCDGRLRASSQIASRGRWVSRLWPRCPAFAVLMPGRGLGGLHRLLIMIDGRQASGDAWRRHCLIAISRDFAASASRHLQPARMPRRMLRSTSMPTPTARSRSPI